MKLEYILKCERLVGVDDNVLIRIRTLKDTWIASIHIRESGNYSWIGYADTADGKSKISHDTVFSSIEEASQDCIKHLIQLGYHYNPKLDSMI